MEKKARILTYLGFTEVRKRGKLAIRYKVKHDDNLILYSIPEGADSEEVNAVLDVLEKAFKDYNRVDADELFNWLLETARPKGVER